VHIPDTPGDEGENVASSTQSTSGTLPGGVRPLRAGTGSSFLWRRLHSLTGIVPVGLFLLEHMLSNAEALNGAAAYNAQVKFLTGLPFRFALELFGVFIPLAFHALYGIYIWWRGDNNVVDYPWAGNWNYTLQRYTGLVVFAYAGWHLWTMRFTGVHLTEHYGAAFWKVQNELHNPLALAFYAVGIVAASWHFGYGLFLFAAKWGIVTGTKAQKRAQLAGVGLSVALALAGLLSLYAFVKTPPQQFNPEWERTAEPAPAEQGRLVPPSTVNSQAR
jgi:succinate dehydrogenase / fumarate reductase cytochrome b subunit